MGGTAPRLPAAMRAPEVCGVVIMTGAVQAPEGQGHGWAWVGWDVVTCLVHRRVKGMGVLAEYQILHRCLLFPGPMWCVAAVATHRPTATAGNNGATLFLSARDK